MSYHVSRPVLRLVSQLQYSISFTALASYTIHHFFHGFFGSWHHAIQDGIMYSSFLHVIYNTQQYYYTPTENSIVVKAAVKTLGICANSVIASHLDARNKDEDGYYTHHKDFLSLLARTTTSTFLKAVIFNVLQQAAHSPTNPNLLHSLALYGAAALSAEVIMAAGKSLQSSASIEIKYASAVTSAIRNTAYIKMPYTSAMQYISPFVIETGIAYIKEHKILQHTGSQLIAFAHTVSEFWIPEDSCSAASQYNHTVTAGSCPILENNQCMPEEFYFIPEE